MSRRRFDLTPERMLLAYRLGLFPMGESRESDRLYWLDPEQRGILPLDTFHIPRRLRRTALSGRFQVTIDQDFPTVIAACALPAEGREDTWINSTIERLFTELHRQGFAHSVECWHDGALVGGLYGVGLGAAFFGESMFSRATDASKVALVHLVARMRLCGFELLDTQFVTTHLAQFGATEIPAEDYKARLAQATSLRAWPLSRPDPDEVQAEIRAMTL